MATSITQTANPAGVSASANVATYSSQSIGPAAPNRIVVVAVASELASTPIDSCTIDYGSGDTAMTAGSAGNFGAVYARLFYLPVPTGTTATIKVTWGTNSPSSTQNHIAVYSVVGGTYSSAGNDGSTDMDATDPLTTGSITIASGGGFIAVAGGATDTAGKTWANATEDIDADAGALRFTTATRTTALTTTAVTCTGATNGEDGALSYIIFTENTSPTVALNSPADAASTGDLTPDLTFTGTDAQSDDVRYNVQVHTVTPQDITLGNTGTHNDTGSGDTTAFDSGSSGSNRLLVVGFSNFDTDSTNRQVSTVTYNSVGLTKVTGSVADNATSNGRAEIWYLVNPATGSNNLAVTFAGANNITNSDYFYAIFNNVDQSNPINDSDNGTTVAGTQQRITLTTTNNNEMLVDVNNGDVGGQTLGTGQTSLMDASGSTGRGSYKLANINGNYNMDMNTTSNDNYAHGAISLKPSVIPTIDKVSGTDAGFSGTPDNTDPFTSGQAVTYTVQSDLTASTTYYWRVRGIDPSGSNAYGAWSSTRSFTATAGGGTSYTPTYTETMTLVDTIPRATSRNLTEAVTYVDTVLKNPARILTDVTILVDTIVRAPGKLQSEVMTLVDTYSRVWITSRTFEETTTLVDTVPKSTSRTLSDQASLIDTIVFSTGKVLTEAMTLVDTITKSISRTLTDASTLVDTLEKNAGRLLSEAITLVDSLIRSVGRFLLEVVTMVDSIIKSISRTLSEVLSLVDVLVRGIFRYLSDFFTMVDTFISELISTSYSAILTETITLVDNIEKLFNHIISGIPTTIRHLAQIRPFGFIFSKNKPTGSSFDDVKPEGSSGRGIENGISLKDKNKPSMM